MQDDHTVYMTVPSRLAVHINFAYRFDHPRILWRWYWMRHRLIRHIRAAAYSPFAGFIMAVLITRTDQESLPAQMIGLAVLGICSVLGLRHYYLARRFRMKMAAMEQATLLSWADVKERVKTILADRDEDALYEEVAIELEPGDLM